MKQNIGHYERLLRIAIGTAILYGGIVTDHAWAYAGSIPLFTGAGGWCPLYRILGLNTRCKNCRQRLEEESQPLV